MEAKVVRSSSNSQPCLSEEEEIEQGSRIEICKKVFTAYFSKLCKALPVKILPELVSCNIITMEEMEKISAEDDKVCVLLYGHIWKGICSGCPEVFTKLLSIMCSIGCEDPPCKELSIEISTKLEINAGDMSRE